MTLSVGKEGKTTMTEVCPYCGRPTSTKQMTDKEMEEALLSDKPLEVSPPCMMCAGHTPNYIITSKAFKAKYEELLK